MFKAVFLGDRIVLMSKGPGKVFKIYEVNIDRIRDRLDPEYLKLKQDIMGELERS